MADDPKAPKQSWVKTAFDKSQTAKPEPPAPEPTRTDNKTSHDPKPALNYEMKGPGGNTVRQDIFHQKQANLSKSAAPPVSETEHQKQRDQKQQKDGNLSPNMAKFRDANERGR